VVAVDRTGKELLRSPILTSLEGVAWPPSGQEVWAGETMVAGWSDAIHAFDLKGKHKDRIVIRLPGMLRLHDVSSDGRILLTRESWRSGLQFKGAGDNKERDLAWLDYACLRDLSTDGSEVTFDDWGQAAGAASLAYLRKTDGSPAVKLGAWWLPVLSPGGTQVLATYANSVGVGGKALLPTGVGEVQKLEDKMQQTGARGFVPGGKSVYFAGNDGHGWQMYLQDVSGSPERAVTPVISVKTAHFESHLVSPDGKSIFARDVNGKGEIYLSREANRVRFRDGFQKISGSIGRPMVTGLMCFTTTKHRPGCSNSTWLQERESKSQCWPRAIQPE
jgi:hypothetical protein